MNRRRLLVANARFSRLPLWLVALTLVLVIAWPVPALGQAAYFSLTGNINAPFDEYDASFDLTRAVGSGEDLRFRAYSQVGGVNSAGDFIPASLFDAQLSLFDSADALRGQDRSSAGPDALLSWPGVSFQIPLNPNPLPVDSYRLNIRDFPFDGQQPGPFAVDLIGPDDALVYTGGMPVVNSTLSSLKFGATGGGTATYRLDADLIADYLIEVQANGAIVGNGADGTTGVGETASAIDSSAPFRVLAAGSVQLNGGDGGASTGFQGAGQRGGAGGTIDLDAGTGLLAGVVSLGGGAGGVAASPSTGRGGNGGTGGQIVVASGTTADLSGSIGLPGGAGARSTSGPNSRAGDGGVGGSIEIHGSGILSGTIRLPGGRGGTPNNTLATGGNGGGGGTLSIMGSTTSLTGLITLAGGSARNATQSGSTPGNGGHGGVLNVTDGAASLGGSITATGGAGGNAGNLANNGGRGGRGGTLSMTDGTTSLSGSVSLAGGPGGNANGPIRRGGNGGAGGQLEISGGDVTLEGAVITVAGGNRGVNTSPSGSNGLFGANGSVDVTGGSLALDHGSVLGRTGVASADPLTIAAATLNVSGPGVVEVLDSMTMSNAAGLNVTTGGIVDATPPEAASQQAGVAGRTLNASGTITVDSGTFRYNGGDGGLLGGNFGQGGTGGKGGTLVATGGNIALEGTGQMTFDGGEGGGLGSCCDNFGGKGGSGGEVRLTNTTATLTDSTLLSLRGGTGGNGDTNGDGDGGRGGLLEINMGASLLQGGSSQVLIDGGPGGDNSTIDPGDGGQGGQLTINGGTYTVDETALLSVRGGPGGSGVDGAHGNIDISGGALTINGGTVIAGAVLHPGTGNFNLNGGRLTVDTFDGVLVQDGGAIVIGGSAGTTEVTDAYQQNAGTLEIELFSAGQSPSFIPMAGVDFDQLTADSATLGGALELAVDDGYTPGLGQSFPILTTTNGISGTFADVSGAYLGGGLGLDVQYSANDVTVEVITVLPGDFDVDGDVDGEDFLVWQGDPRIGSLADWQTNYGMASPLAANATRVPEPGSWALLLGVTIVAASRAAARGQKQSGRLSTEATGN